MKSITNCTFPIIGVFDVLKCEMNAKVGVEEYSFSR